MAASLSRVTSPDPLRLRTCNETHCTAPLPIANAASAGASTTSAPGAHSSINLWQMSSIDVQLYSDSNSAGWDLQA